MSYCFIISISGCVLLPCVACMVFFLHYSSNILLFPVSLKGLAHIRAHLLCAVDVFLLSYGREVLKYNIFKRNTGESVSFLPKGKQRTDFLCTYMWGELWDEVPAHGKRKEQKKASHFFLTQSWKSRNGHDLISTYKQNNETRIILHGVHLPAAEELLVSWEVLVLGAGTGTTEEPNIRLGAGTGRLLPSVACAQGEETSEESWVFAASCSVLLSARIAAGPAFPASSMALSLTLGGGRWERAGFLTILCGPSFTSLLLSWLSLPSVSAVLPTSLSCDSVFLA